MGYISKRKLKHDYKQLVRASEVLIASGRASIAIHKSKIAKLERENQLLRERMERIDYDNKIDWEALDREFMESARGRHRKSSTDTSRW